MERKEIEVLIAVAYRWGWRDGMDGKDLPTLKQLDELASGVYERALKSKEDTNGVEEDQNEKEN